MSHPGRVPTQPQPAGVPEPSTALAPARAAGVRRRFGLRNPRLRNRLFLIGAVLSSVVVVVAVLAPVIARGDPLAQSAQAILAHPSGAHPFGADENGRDVFTSVVWGSRTSLIVGLGSVGLGGTVGALIGLFAAFLGGIVDSAAARLVDVLLAFPVLIVAITIVAVLGAGTVAVILALAFAVAPRFARVVRGEALALREREFVDAARTSGASTVRVVLRHILPNMLGPVIVMFTLYLPYAILVESSLSFLGVGVSPDTPSWGNTIAGGREYLEVAWWITVFPGVAISLTVIGFSLLGDGLRDILDPRIEP